MPRRLILALAALAAAAPAAPAAEFAFLHISDIHVSPHPATISRPETLRGADTIAWLCAEAARPQEVSPPGYLTPPPALAIATGDLTEYGVIDETWSDFERAFASLPCPLHVLPGNHDNTWGAMYHILRERHGGENHSFDRFGCHFVCISSASPQEPVPCIDARTRAWLRADLDQQLPGTPVFLALHHPPYVDEFANPAEYDTLIDLLRDYNVALVLYGHGHGVGHRDMDGLDGVMGGSTFGKTAGYGLVSIHDNTLRAAYRYHRRPGAGDAPPAGPGWVALLEKPLTRDAPRRLFQIAAPTARVGDPEVGPEFDLALELAAGLGPADIAELTVRVDGADAATRQLGERGPPAWRVQAGKLTPGRHLLSVRLKTTDGRRDLRTAFISAAAGHDAVIWRTEFPAGLKAGPVVAGDLLIVAGTDGVVRGLERRTGLERWTFATGGEILAAPACADGRLVFGSGDGRVYALAAAGGLIWSFSAGVPVYGAPCIDGDTVYIGDNTGRLHAFDLSSGQPRWTFARAEYAVECRPCVWDDRVVFGAWDGRLYAVARADGRLLWKVPGPKASDTQGSRYYAPADCGPVALGERLLVCDRGYILGTFDRDGTPGARPDTGIAAIAADPAGRGLYARGLEDRVAKLGPAGEKLWDAPVPAGRFPVPPTVAGGSVYICSNRGLLSVLDAADGRQRWQYQVTPGFYVMAPVCVDDQGICYVAGMDGTVTALRPGAGP